LADFDQYRGILFFNPDIFRNSTKKGGKGGKAGKT
jgi:hypothetical protein